MRSIVIVVINLLLLLLLQSLPVIAILHQIVFRINVWLKVKYVPGVNILIADTLSGLQIQEFRILVPDADPVGMSCPPHLWDLV